MSGLELWSYTFRDATLVDLAKAAGASGFRWITATADQVRREHLAPAALRARVEEHGVGFSAIDGVVSALPGTPHHGSASAAGLRECVDLAATLGAKTVNLVHIDGSPTPLDALAEAFALACRTARETGLALAIEFLPGTGIPDLRTCVDVVLTSGAPNGSVLLDTWHFARSGGTLTDLDPATTALVGALQLADRAPEQDLQPYVPMRDRKVPGDGALPLADIVARVRTAHPTIPIGVEVLSEQMDNLGPVEGAKLLAARCRRFLV